MSEAPLFRKRGPKGRGAGKAREKSVERDNGSGSSDSDTPTITVKQRRLTSQKNPLFQKTTRRATDRTEELDHKYTATSGLEKRDAAAEQKEDATRTVEIDAVEDAEAKRLLERHMAESEMEVSLLLTHSHFPLLYHYHTHHLYHRASARTTGSTGVPAGIGSSQPRATALWTQK